MHYVVIFALLVASVMAEGQLYSISTAVGSGSGSAYTITGDDRITGVRVWEAYSNFIYGFQFRYGPIWSSVAGRTYGQPKEFLLFEGEKIIQVSGKYAHYIQSLVFATNMGRSMFVGQPSGHSFNMYAGHKEAELRFISGRYHGALTSIQTHWGVIYTEDSQKHW